MISLHSYTSKNTEFLDDCEVTHIEFTLISRHSELKHWFLAIPVTSYFRYLFPQRKEVRVDVTRGSESSSLPLPVIRHFVEDHVDF
jgi:hypothetical protein